MSELPDGWVQTKLREVVSRRDERAEPSSISAAFRGDLTAEWRALHGNATDQVQYEKLERLISDIRYGTARKCNYEITNTPVLRIPNVGGGRILHDDLKYAEFSDSEIEKLEVKPDDLLIIRSNGSLNLVGRAALVTKKDAGFLFAGYLIRIRPVIDKIHPTYLLHSLSEPSVRREIEGLAKSTSGVNNINSGQLKSLSIPVRSLGEQQEIVRRVEAALNWIDKTVKEHDGASHLIERLDQSILAKAFRGDLVPQDPNDEPASVLLERIHAARAEQLKQIRGRQLQQVTVPRAPRERAAMTKSRQDDDVKNKPYLADILRESGSSASVEDLFQRADLPLIDFYKQLAWEVDAGHIRDDDTRLEAA